MELGETKFALLIGDNSEVVDSSGAGIFSLIQ